MKGTRVLVLDADKRQALAACRALGRAGYDVGAASSFDAALAGWSRYTARYHVLPSSRGSTQDYAVALRSLVADRGYDAVVAVEDPSVAQLAEAGLDIPTVPVIGPALDRLVDKRMLTKLAAAAGVDYPATEPAPGDGSFEAAGARLGLPLVVKPLRSAAVVDGRVAHYSGAKVASDEHAANEAAARIRAHGLDPIVQRRIERSDKINVTIFRRDGRSEVRFPYRVLCDVPLTGGIAVSLETVDAGGGVGAAAVVALERVCDAAGYEGIANGEFCVAQDDRRLVLIEVNTRPWGSLWFAERLGQRVIDRAVRHALGRPAEPARSARPGRRYHNPAGERRWVSLHEHRRGPLLEVLRRLRPWDVFEYVDVTDPGATLRYAVAKARGTIVAEGE
jgi:biotin carboxylase